MQSQTCSLAQSFTTQPALRGMGSSASLGVRGGRSRLSPWAGLTDPTGVHFHEQACVRALNGWSFKGASLQADHKPRGPRPRGLLLPSLKPRAPSPAGLSSSQALEPHPIERSSPSPVLYAWEPQILPCQLAALRHSLEVTVDVHPAILGDADEESVQGNLHVLEMHRHESTKESDPKHGEHLPERPKSVVGLTRGPWRQRPCKCHTVNAAKGVTGTLAGLEVSPLLQTP